MFSYALSWWKCPTRAVDACELTNALSQLRLQLNSSFKFETIVWKQKLMQFHHHSKHEFSQFLFRKETRLIIATLLFSISNWTLSRHNYAFPTNKGVDKSFSRTTHVSLMLLNCLTVACLEVALFLIHCEQ